MKTAGRISKRILIVVISAIAAVLLVAGITFAASGGIDNFINNSNDGDPSLGEVHKSGDWTTQYNKAQVQISANAQGAVKENPKILFIGTMCTAHGLEAGTVIKAIHSASKAGPVDYFLYKSPEKSGSEHSGHLEKNESISKEEQAIISRDFQTGNHRSLGRFLDCLYENVTDINSYDFIFFEFDRSVIAHSYGTPKTGTDPNPACQYGDEAVGKVVNLLQQYYDKNKVGWLVKKVASDTGCKEAKGPNGEYYPSTCFYRLNKNFWLDASQYSGLLSVTYPKKYQEPFTEIKDYPEQQIENQKLYTDAEHIGDFVTHAIESLTNYSITIEDTIQSTNKGCTIDKDNIKFQMKNDAGEWSDVDKKVHPVTVKCENNKVTATVTKLQKATEVRLLIPFSTITGLVDFRNESADGLPNNGNATVTMTTNDGSLPSKTTTETPTLDWPVDIKYKVNPDDQVGNKVQLKDGTEPASSVSEKGTGTGNKLMTNDDYETYVKGATPSPAPGWVIDYWVDDKKPSEKIYQEDMKGPPGPNNRNVSNSYTAFFKPAVTLDKDASKEYPNVIKGGEQITYTLTAGNESVSPVTTATVTDKLNGKILDLSDLSKIVLTPSNPDDSVSIAADGTITWKPKNIPAGDKTTLTIQANVIKDFKGTATLKNKAAIKDTGYSIDSGEVSTPVEPRDVHVEYKYLIPSPVDTPPVDNDPYPYGSKYTNLKQADVVGGFEFSGWYADEGLTKPFAENNDLLADLTMIYGKYTPKMTISKKVDQTQVNGGEAIDYILTVQNNSANDASDVSVSDTLDTTKFDLTKDITTEPAYKSFDPATGQVKWEGLIVPGNAGTKIIKIKAYTKNNISATAAVKNFANASVKGVGLEKSNTVETTIVPKDITVHYQPSSTSPYKPGQEKLPPDDTKKCGEEYQDVEPQAIPGYTFDGWYKEDECKNIYTKTKLYDDTILYGKWTENKVHINYISEDEAKGTVSLDGEDVNAVTTEQAEKGSVATPKGGYVFDRWTKGESGTTKGGDQANFKPYKEDDLWVDGTTYVAHFIFKGSISKTEEKYTTENPARGGDTIEYKIHVSNPSSAKAEKVKVTDDISSYMHLYSEVTPKPSADGIVTWDNQVVEPDPTGLDLTLKVVLKKDLTADDCMKPIINSVKANFGKDSCSSENVTTPIAPRLIKLDYKFDNEAPKGITVPDPVSGLEYGSKFITEKRSAPGYTFDGWYTINESGVHVPFKDNETQLVDEIIDPTNDTVHLHGQWAQGATIAKSVNPKNVKEGEEFTYTITLHNSTSSEMIFAKVVDELDDQIEYVKKSTDEKYDSENRKVYWVGVSVGPNSDKTLSFVAKACLKEKVQKDVPNHVYTEYNDYIISADCPVNVEPKFLKINYHYVKDVEHPDIPEAAKIPEDVDPYPYGNTYKSEDQPPVPGWKFDGWYSDEDMTQKYPDAGKKLTDNLDLYGCWSKAVTVTKVAKIGERTSVEAGENVEYHITIKNDSPVSIHTSIIDKIDDNFKTVVILPGGASYDEKTRTVSYDPYDIAPGATDEVFFTAQTKLDIDPNRPEVSNTAVVNIDQGEGHDPLEFDSNQVDTPVTPKKGIVTFEYQGSIPDGAVAPGQDGPYFYGHEYSADSKKPDVSKYPGYSFDGWYLSDGSKYVDGTKIMQPETHLIGKWKNETTITKANTPEGDVVAGDFIEYTITATNPTSTPIAEAVITDEVQSDFLTSSVVVQDGGTFDGKTITWKKSIEAGGSVTVKFKAQTNDIASQAITYENKAKLTVLKNSIESNVVKNKAMPLRSIVVNKNWSDESRHNGKTEAGDYEFVNVQLYQDEKPYREMIKLTPADKWKDTAWAKEITGLPVYKSEGVEYQYTIKEFAQDGSAPVSDVYTHKLADGNTAEYTPSYSYSKSAATVTNTYNVKPSDLSLDKTGDKKTAKPGEDINYTITAKYGPQSGSAVNVVIEDKLPDGLIYKSSDPEGSYDASTGKVTWIIDSIKGGSSKEIHLTCSVPADAKTKTYSNSASIIAYGTLPPEVKVSKDELTPTPLMSVGCKITKSIVRNAGTEEEQDYLSTNETIGGDAILRYYCFKYVAPELEEAVIKDELPDGLIPPKDGEYDDYSLTSSYDVDKKRYTVTLTLKNPLRDDRTPVNLPVTIDPTIDKHHVMVSPATLTSVYKPSESEREDFEAKSNETKMVVDVPTPLPTPIPVPKPVVTDVKEITVVKTWSDGALAHITDTIKVGLYADGELKYTQDLNTSNLWTYTWEEMPIKTDAGNPIKYTLKEETQVDGYKATIEESEDGDFTVVNEKIVPPANPEQPAGSGLTQTLDDKTLIMIVCFFVFGACISGFALRVHRRRHM